MAIKSNLKSVKSKLEVNKKNALDDIGKHLSMKVSEKAPVDTGELRDSVDYKVNEAGVVIGASAEHSKSIELGSSRAPAQPFLEPTVMSNIDEIEKIIVKNMSKM